MVMVPPGLIGEEGENPTVIGTLVLPAMRSDDAMTKETSLTCPNIAPDATGKDGTVSAELSR